MPHWRKVEDELLIQLYYKIPDSKTKWLQISQEMIIKGFHNNPSRCRVRWMNYLNPLLDLSPVTHKELVLFVDKYSTFGKIWSEYLPFFPRRSYNFIKNLYPRAVRSNLILPITKWSIEEDQMLIQMIITGSTIEDIRETFSLHTSESIGKRIKELNYNMDIVDTTEMDAPRDMDAPAPRDMDAPAPRDICTEIDNPCEFISTIKDKYPESYVNFEKIVTLLARGIITKDKAISQFTEITGGDMIYMFNKFIS